MIYKMKVTLILSDFFRWVFILPKKYFQLLLHIDAFRPVGYVISCNIYSAMSVVCYQKRNILFSLTLQPNSGLGRLHDTFRFTSVTGSRTPLVRLISSSQGFYLYTNTEKTHI
jgi:hypothetical protein